MPSIDDEEEEIKQETIPEVEDEESEKSIKQLDLNKLNISEGDEDLGTEKEEEEEVVEEEEDNFV